MAGLLRFNGLAFLYFIGIWPDCFQKLSLFLGIFWPILIIFRGIFLAKVKPICVRLGRFLAKVKHILVLGWTLWHNTVLPRIPISFQRVSTPPHPF